MVDMNGLKQLITSIDWNNRKLQPLVPNYKPCSHASIEESETEWKSFHSFNKMKLLSAQFVNFDLIINFTIQ